MVFAKLLFRRDETFRTNVCNIKNENSFLVFLFFFMFFIFLLCKYLFEL